MTGTRENEQGAFSLAAGQYHFIDTIQKGPSACPDDLFDGPMDRVLLGLKSHANTISHARLVALEQTYPRAREHMGHEEFHRLSRLFVDQAHVMQRSLNIIGEGFGTFVSSHQAEVSERATTVGLIEAEWYWLESYNAADAESLTMADVAALDEAGLVSLPICSHPSLRIIDAASADAAAFIMSSFDDLTDAPVAQETSATAVLTVRPDHEVIIRLIEDVDWQLIRMIQKSSRMGNLLQYAIEQWGEETALARVFALIEAGVVIRFLGVLTDD